MSIFTRAIQIFSDRGYRVHSGVNPHHVGNHSQLSAPFTALATPGKGVLSTGGGIAPVEVYLIESLAEVMQPRNIFIIGNAFGWSTVVLALAFPNAKVVALDAGIEGEDNMAGIHLTNDIASEHGLNVVVEHGFSPADTGPVIERHFGSESVDLVFIDGLHTNDQLILDFDSVSPYCSPSTVYLYHDVINWKLQPAFGLIRQKIFSHETRLLHRTTSGMGVSYPRDLSQKVRATFDAFSEDVEYINNIVRSRALFRRARVAIAKVIPVSLMRRRTGLFSKNSL